MIAESGRCEDLPCRFVHGSLRCRPANTSSVRRITMPHPAMSPNHVAVITGGASGIGLAAAMRFAGFGMKVCIADIGAERLAEAAARLAAVAKGGAADIMTAS